MLVAMLVQLALGLVPEVSQELKPLLELAEVLLDSKEALVLV
jgi:hypothetical protein